METLKNNKWLAIFLAALLGNAFLFASFKVMVYVITKEVIKELKSEYTPGPYTPGFNPDEVDEDTLKQKAMLLRPKAQSIDFRTKWEQDRGFE